MRLLFITLGLGLGGALAGCGSFTLDCIDGCNKDKPMDGAPGQDGEQGAAGAAGPQGEKGEPGESLSVVTLPASAESCGEAGGTHVAYYTSETVTYVGGYTVCNGLKGDTGETGATGAKGEDGQDGSSPTISEIAESLPFIPKELIDLCGNADSYGEVLIRLGNGQLLAHYSSGGKNFLTVVKPGSYQTTDDFSCQFTVDEELVVEDEDGNIFLP